MDNILFNAAYEINKDQMYYMFTFNLDLKQHQQNHPYLSKAFSARLDSFPTKLLS